MRKIFDQETFWAHTLQLRGFCFRHVPESTSALPEIALLIDGCLHPCHYSKGKQGVTAGMSSAEFFRRVPPWQAGSRRAAEKNVARPCAPDVTPLSAQRRYARRNSVKRLTAVVKLCCLSRLPCNAGTFRHRCGARSSKPAAGFTVCGRFDSYTSPPISDPRCFRRLKYRTP